MHIDTFTGAGLTRLCGVMLVHGVAWRKVYVAVRGCASSCRDNIDRYPDRGIYTPADIIAWRNQYAFRNNAFEVNRGGEYP